MIGFRFKMTLDTGQIARAINQAERRAMFRGAAFVRSVASRSIRKSRTASAPGRPPKTRRGRLRRAIRFSVDASNTAVIGPVRSQVGTVGAAHEQGGLYRGEIFNQRPFMRPALEKSRDKIAEFWRDTLR